MYKVPFRGQPIGLAVLVYAVLVALAVTWAVVAGRPHLVLDPAVVTWHRAALGLAAGAALGLATVLMSRLTVARLAWARSLYRWFAAALGPLSRRDVLLLAALSSVGEELFFRGAMQPSLGLWLTTLIFTLAHLPPTLRFLPWTISAGVMGLCFGLISRHSGTVAGAVVAHFIINYLNLGQVSQFYRSEGLTPIDRIHSIGQDDANGEHSGAGGGAGGDRADGEHPGPGAG